MNAKRFVFLGWAAAVAAAPAWARFESTVTPAGVNLGLNDLTIENNWTNKAAWFKTDYTTALGAYPCNGGAYAVDSAREVLVTTSNYVSQTIVGYKAGYAGHLRVDGAAALLGKHANYAHSFIGYQAGATGVVTVANGGGFPFTDNVHVWHAGERGVAVVTNDAGVFGWRERCYLGCAPGSEGTYVNKNSGRITPLSGGKGIWVGVEGKGTFEMAPGTPAATNQLLGTVANIYVGCSNAVESSLIINPYALISSGALLYLGGSPYVNKSDTDAELPHGRGCLDLRGGDLRLTASGSLADPKFRIGWYTNSYGMVKGWGRILASNTSDPGNLYVGLGNGRIVGDGQGVERTLDLTEAVQITRTPHAQGDTNGWYAVNKGCVWFPRSWRNTASGTVCFGCARDETVPNLVNAVRFDYVRSSAKDVRFYGGLYALDRDDIHMDTLPHKGPVLGVWKFAMSGNMPKTWQTNPLDFNTVNVTFRYDPAKLTRAALGVKVWRWQDGAWSRVGRSALNAGHTVTTDALAPVSDGTPFNVGLFAVVEQREGLQILVR